MSGIDSVLKEGRIFPPPPEFQGKAHVKSLEDYSVLARLREEEE